MKFKLIIEPEKGSDTDLVNVHFTAANWDDASKYAEVFQRQIGVKGMAVVVPVEINRNLIAAYRGAHEETLANIEPDKREDTIRAVIRGDSPLKRLQTYLTWEGIHGYSETIFGIANSEPAAKD